VHLKNAGATAPPSILSPLEIAAHSVTGPGLSPLAKPAQTSVSPLQALETAILPSLAETPCLVSFSGGHDSSVVLGIAVRLARRESLSLPIPISLRFTDAPRAEESELQEAVVRSLGLSDWELVSVGDELDVIGPVAGSVLKAHGLLYPANAHIHAPLPEGASGGTLLKGFGGDQAFRQCPRSRRPWWAARRPDPPAWPWLTRQAATQVHRSLGRERHLVPKDEASRGRWRANRRDVNLACSSVAAIAAGQGAEIRHPLLDAEFLEAVETTGITPSGAGGRAGIVKTLFGEALPPECVARRNKAHFREVIWQSHTRAAISPSRIGQTIEALADGYFDGLVDLGALRREWAGPEPNSRTALLLQRAWLVLNNDGEGGQAQAWAPRRPRVSDLDDRGSEVDNGYH
jgi:asparagine synthetase B (glutamine-hydrolysing)